MAETLTLSFAGLAGLTLGTLYFGGLWWTLGRALRSKVPALWFLVSLLVRTAMTLVGFYIVANHHWDRLLVCLLGFVMARLIVTRFTGSADKSNVLGQEGNHAPYSR